ncbi:hypothetical protein Poli38472_002563 [Pythium oligandrum]|uniref:Uncharacterized protein n=1 Tax=Pythium oligandrum TaxID=41045 RepID=A0A8K1CHR3_PYTOL|nr:hypothetical protein Poli38472_002563 [Pythium oligandrum]|eukprot:TMW63622.1 hypothetical protein Poli38472_002563 [Pythium oligandrum]
MAKAPVETLVSGRESELHIPSLCKVPLSRMSHTSCSSEDEESAPVPTALMAIPSLRRCRSSNKQEVPYRRRRSVSANSLVTMTNYRSSISSIATTASFDDEDEMTDTLIVPLLPAAPYPVDPYHFYSRGVDAALQLVQEIRDLLSACDIEFSFEPHKCKFKCVKYVQYSQVEFVLRIYVSNDAMLLEFQRRSGSLLLWDGLYSLLYHKLLYWVDTTAPACPQSGKQKKVASRAEDSMNVDMWQRVATSKHQVTSGLESMNIMITSPYVDVQREACAGLAAITGDAQNAYQVAKSGMVESLIKLASSADREVARCSIGTLGNIAQAVPTFPDEKLASQTLEQTKRAASVVVGLLGEAIDTFTPLELLRECAQVMTVFSRICPSEALHYQAVPQLEHYIDHCDPQLAGFCREAIQQLLTNV